MNKRGSSEYLGQANILIGIYLDRRIFCQAKNVLGDFVAWQMLSIATVALQTVEELDQSVSCAKS